MAAAIFLASVHGKCLRYTEILKMLMSFLRRKTVRCSLWNMDDESECFVTAQISTNKNSRNQNRLLAKSLAAVKKVGQKNGEVGLLVECLFCEEDE